VNGDIAVETTKGKGKGKGKGKSSVISDKTPKEIDSAQQTKPTPRTKRASKSAAELYRKILDDDENGDPIMDEESSDEDVVYGQEESDSDDVEEVRGIFLNNYRICTKIYILHVKYPRPIW
jgi:hypothetical protein